MRINNDEIFLRMSRKKMSRQALAEASGISYEALTAALNRGRMTTEKLGRIAEALECDVEEIVLR